jgi:CheY-like chemotaxis protein
MITDRNVIIVADDHDDQRALITIACEREGFEVVEATDGLELVDLVRARRDRGELGDVMLVISDIMMPGLTGLDACAVLAREGVDVPFLFASALNDPETRARTQELHSLGLFVKPFELNTLRQFLRDYARN